ncbi:hypothetical protein H6H01_05965 [Nostoc calcicola FACHB-3891]|nr:hypothetical protein [Nostoc calcicola FACHB-3891]
MRILFYRNYHTSDKARSCLERDDKFDYFVTIYDLSNSNIGVSRQNGLNLSYPLTAMFSVRVADSDAESEYLIRQLV